MLAVLASHHRGNVSGGCGSNNLHSRCTIRPALPLCFHDPFYRGFSLNVFRHCRPPVLPPRWIQPRPRFLQHSNLCIRSLRLANRSTFLPFQCVSRRMRTNSIVGSFHRLQCRIRLLAGQEYGFSELVNPSNNVINGHECVQCQSFHHSTSCIQNSRQQMAHPLEMSEHPPSSPRYAGEIVAGQILNTPSVRIRAPGHCSRNTLCRVLRGCAADHSSTIATIRL